MSQDRRYILIRGLAREAGHWHDFGSRLQRELGPGPVETYELAGNGRRWRERSPTSIRPMAADLRRHVGKQEGPLPLLIAVSLGAMVALEWLRVWPEDRVAGLVVINTSVGALSRPWHRVIPRALGSLLRASFQTDARDRERAVLGLTTSWRRGDIELTEAHANLHREHPVSRINLARQGLAAVRFRAPALRLKVPVLVLSGSEDRLVDPRCSRVLAAALGARHRICAGAGQDLSLDDPSWCSAQICDWFGTVDPQIGTPGHR